MPLDEQVQRYLKAREARNLPPTPTQTPAQHRMYLDSGPFPAGPELPAVTNADIGGTADQAPIPIRIYRPTMASGLPVLLFFHGGGWLCGTLDSIDGTMRHLAQRSGCLIVSVAYRLAPEHKYPAALEDCARAALWAKATIADYGGDPANLSVGGASAGANLAAALTMMWRDQRLQAFRSQLLVYPCLNPACDTPSYDANRTGLVLTTAGMLWYWNHYLRQASDMNDSYAAPLVANDFTGLPPALIVTAEYDPLRDDGAEYARKLREAGSEVQYEEYPGVIHGFFNQWHAIDKGLQSVHEAADWLKTR